MQQAILIKLEVAISRRSLILLPLPRYWKRAYIAITYNLYAASYVASLHHGHPLML